MKNNYQTPLFFVGSYRDALSLFRRYVAETVGISVGEFTFAECTRDCVLGFMNCLSEMKSKGSTRNHRLAALRSYLTFAADKDIGLQSIELEVKRVLLCKVPRTEKTVLQEEAITANLTSHPIQRWASGIAPL